MNRIKVLPKDTIRKISSGELISKPFIILKELLENSLDAKSSLLKIYLKNKGMDLIKVVDNGFGIDKENLLMCIKNNSTNKIFFFEDLKNLNTFGFRGEALSNISSISEFYISSRYIKKKLGWLLYNDLNNTSKFYIKPVSHNIGTIVSVKNIYFNVPYKRNELFLYLNNEWLLIKKIINNFILCNYNTTFYIFNNNNLYNKYINNNNLRKRECIINRINSIYGKLINNFYVKIYEDYWYCYGYFLNFIKFKSIKLIFINNRIINNNNFLFSLFNNFITNYLNIKNLSYIFYFFIEYKYIDINICSNKNKISFLNNFNLYNSIYNNLLLFFKKYKYINKFKYNNDIKFNYNNFNNIKYYILKESNKDNYLQYFLFNFGKIINIINNKFLISLKDNYIIVSNLYSLFYYFNILILKYKFYNFIWTKKVYLLFKIKYFYSYINNDIINLLNKIGIYFIINKKKLNIIFIRIPLILQNLNFNKFLFNLNKFLSSKNNYSIISIIYWIKKYIYIYNTWNINNSIILVSNFCKIIKYIDFNKKVFKFFDLNYFLLYYI